MIVTGNHPICKEIAEAFGFVHARKLTLRIGVGEAASVTAEFYPDEEQMRKALTVVKKYKLNIEEE